ncbi:MAG: (d)CMP kinase [Lachnospiraceae bacterium]|nr:(d)CMP kinase [Lachnospiraceae bacterium]
MSYNIAIDGPAGAGKSTIAKIVAERLSFIYIDTGAMYRAIAIYFIDNEVNLDDDEEIINACSNIDISIKYEGGVQQVILNGENVTSRLRDEEVGRMASICSVFAPVREKLVKLQQSLATKEDVVMDGRDIGTVVLPNANVKVYLTASSKARAKRRYLELTQKGISCNIEEIEEEIIERDKRDMERKISPLRKAEDAVLVDSSNLSIEEVVEAITDLIN